MSADGMKLPIGMTCGDCVHFKRCVMLFDCPATNTSCDWSPSRFRPANVNAVAQALLANNGGPVDSVDGPDTYVMVRREDFEALEATLKGCITNA
jgi:hypothetical protein